ncbi:MAG: hypothetical protein WCB69_13040, partial [Pseudolabrys sp.]
MAILYFVPQDGQLGKNQKRAGQEIFDIYYWMDSWPHLTDLLRNEKPVQFEFDDSNNTAQIRSVRATVPGGSLLSVPKTLSIGFANAGESEHDCWMFAIAFLFVRVLCDCFK